MAKAPLIVSWSGGKDSALLLAALRDDPAYEVVGLLTTVTGPYDRISIHGVRRDILHAQAAELTLPLTEAVIPASASNALYEQALAAALAQIRRAVPAVRTIGFGDLFLEDVRTYRERLLADLGWRPAFPLWGRNTAVLARRFVEDGFRAIVCCVDTARLPPDRAGREFDTEFLETLPGGVDPCGERGEFHTCVYAGPIFRGPLALGRGERVRREDRFEYCDLRLERATGATAAA
jgi:uncharacterized protein (TIGR00290 family)